MKDSIRVMICDDHQILIDGLKLLLSEFKGIQVVGDTHNGQEALDWLEVNEVDIILMDISMPIMDGLTACKMIQKSHPEVKVIFLSMINQVSIVQSLVSSGSKGYLLKNSGGDELATAINKVFGGGVYFDDRVFEASEQKKQSKFTQELLPKITKREKQILGLIVEEFTSSEIAEKLFISLGTVETHRRNLISKMSVKNTAGLVRMAIQHQLI